MEKVLLVGIRLPGVPHRDINVSIDELSRLAETVNALVVDTIIQTRQRYDPGHLISKDKAKEISGIAKANNIRTIIFNKELTPTQQRNLEETIGAKIIDRTRLILDIFARRARTKEGALQVELAQYTYFLPRITKQGLWLDGQVGGIGTRGPGERKLEYDRRRIRDHIVKLKNQIDSIRSHRDLQRRRRKASGIPVIDIIGYTNVGKSTLFNAIIKKNAVYADDKLFATLDPTIRNLTLPSGKKILVTDTVGFIRDLPHQLIMAFRATLEEITSADCLIHLIDAISSEHDVQEKVVFDTISELGAINVPLIRVYNKCDLLNKRQLKPRILKDDLFISAKTDRGIDKLLIKIDEMFRTEKTNYTIKIPYAKLNLLPIIHQYSNVTNETYGSRNIKLHIKTDSVGWHKLQKHLIQTN